MPDLNTIMWPLSIGAWGVLLFLLQKTRSQIKQKELALKNLQQQLEEQKKQSTTERTELNVILSSMVEGVLVTGKDGKIQYISPNVVDMFDFRSPKITDKPYWETIPHGQMVAAIKEALSTRKAVSKEIVILRGEDVHFNIQVSPVINEGVLLGAVAVFHDISAFKKLLKMRSEFVANVSHELKTPLTSIKGYVETLSEEGALEDGETAKKFLRVIDRQAQRLEALVKDLLTLSAIESREVAMDFQPTDLSVVIHQAINVLKSPIDAAKHQIVIHLPAGLPKVPLDLLRMEQVFINLIDNAVKFTPQGGRIEINASWQSPYLKVDVTDSGIGIASEHWPRLFERFYRVEKSRSSDLGGTGLGLAIVKHIVLAHHGRVEVHSKLGAGTTFSVFLPPVKN